MTSPRALSGGPAAPVMPRPARRGAIRSSAPTVTPDAVVAAVRARGSDARDLLLAAHEAAHAIDLGLSSMTPLAIDKGLMRLPPRRRHEHEVTAHAVGNRVCAELGVACQSIEASVSEALIGALKSGGLMPPAAEFARQIREAMGTSRARRIADAVLALGGRR